MNVQMQGQAAESSAVFLTVLVEYTLTTLIHVIILKNK